MTMGTVFGAIPVNLKGLWFDPPLSLLPVTCFDGRNKQGWHMSVSASGLAAVRPTAEQSRKAIYAATIGNVMEWYDFGVFGYLAGSLALNFFPKGDPASALLNSF